MDATTTKRFGPVDPRDADVSDWHVCAQGTQCYSIHDGRSGPVAYDFASVAAAEAFIALVRKHGSRRLTVG
jgi:hypothetical protein